MAAGVLVGRGYISIRPEFEGNWSQSVNAHSSAAGRSGAGAFSKAFGAGIKGVGALAGVAIAANLSNVAAASAALAPALATAGTAAAALKLGLSGVGDAFKAAFSDSTADATAAASATKAVEGAQRGLANAQRALADARVQAAERVKAAQQDALAAERDLTDAQRDARSAQADLTGARQDATRALEDMNTQLAQSHLDERDAVLRLKQATADLKKAQQAPGTTPDELARLQLAYDRAALNLKEQQRDTKRLAADTKAANKAGVEGSTQVLSAKEKIASADRDVADKQRALSEAQAGVDKARVEGQRQVADAQRAVADAAAAVADAQAAAAAQTSALDKAMAKLAPNAQSFVRAIQGLAPAWDAMRMGVQNRLFEGLDTAVTSLGQTSIPILQRQLTATAGIWNTIAKNAIGAISEMAKSGMLEQILSGATKSFATLERVPGQLITAFGQLSVAAQPAFTGLLNQFAGAVTHFTDGLAASFASGGLKQAVDTAFGILSQLGTLLGNAFGVVTQIFKAASDAGGQILGVLSAVLGEVRRILALPEIQAQLRTLFAGVAQIVGALVPVLGALVQAAVPLLAAIAPGVAALAQVLGPVLSQLATSLGAALMPLIVALMPVVQQVGTALIQIVQAITPLLAPIGALITTVVAALAPALTPVINLVVGLVDVLVGPLTTVITALTPALQLVGSVISQVFTALEPVLTPLVALIGQVATLIAGLFTQGVTALLAAIQPLIPVGIQLVQSVVGALAPILPIVGQAIGVIAQAFGQLMGPITGVYASLAKQLAPVLGKLAPIIGQLGTILAGALAAALPPLTKAFLILVDALIPIFPLIGQLLGIVVQLGADLLAQLLPPLLQLVQAGVDLVIALLPILPPLAELVGLVVTLAVKVLSFLLPPLLKLVSFLVVEVAGALGAVIGWVSSLVSWFADKLAPIVTWLWQTVLSPIFGFIGAAAKVLLTAVVVVAIAPIIVAFKLFGAIGKWLWEKAIKPAFDAIAAGAMWLWNNAIKPVFTWISDKAKWLYNIGIKPAVNSIKGALSSMGDAAKALWTKAISPAFNWISDKAKWLYSKALKPQFDLVKSAAKSVGDSFKTVVGVIKTQWDKLEGITKKPINFIINTVYNKGLVGVWNKVADAFGAPKLSTFKFAQGGVLPGYTPGRDPHKFYSPTGGQLEMSGGESIFRPEFTRGVGTGFVNYFNGLAKSGGASKVRAALAPVLGGNPTTRTDRTLRYKDGGIFGWIGKGASAVAGAGSAAWNGIKKGASWLADTLESSARAGVKAVVNPLLKDFPGMDTGFGKMLRKVPDRILNSLFGYSKEADKKGAGGIGGPKIQAALKWARTQNGLPYQWGGNGNPSWDCSGFMSAIESVIRGQKPHRRWATGAFSGKTAPPGWVLNGKSPFMIGITNSGVGHTAGTLGKTNVESSGGAGVHMGASARGWNDPLFTSHYGFMPGKFDAGGYLQPGMNLAYNGTGRPEPVFTTAQANALTRQAATPSGGVFEGDLVLDSGEFLGRVRGEVHQQMTGLTTMLRAGRG